MYNLFSCSFLFFYQQSPVLQIKQVVINNEFLFFRHSYVWYSMINDLEEINVRFAKQFLVNKKNKLLLSNAYLFIYETVLCLQISLDGSRFMKAVLLFTHSLELLIYRMKTTICAMYFYLIDRQQLSAMSFALHLTVNVDREALEYSAEYLL